MISVILYGRNDNYGYNLHKRVALSLNCIAQLLSEDDDEILFVDYNSPNDLPTLPEAIRDTLTVRAREKIRVLRVRPEVHKRFQSRTHLPVLEAVARNIAIRRSNPENPWVLSTNGDMIFTTREQQSLSAIVRGLAPGLYHIPRVDLPEALWETFDRLDVAKVFDAVRYWSAAAHLNEITRCDFVRFDSPGDFQLMLRSDLTQICGFDERLLKGWHLDYNIAKRLGFLYGGVSDLSHEIVGYHCDHTRRSTLTHGPDHLSNSWQLTYETVSRSDIPDQATSWGCPDVEIEEIRIVRPDTLGYLEALRTALPKPMVDFSSATRNEATYDRTNGDPAHVLPFLINLIASAPRGWTAVWFGCDQSLFDLFCRAWGALGFQRQILVPQTFGKLLARDGTSPARIADGTDIDGANVLIFDFHGDAGGNQDSNDSGAVVGGDVEQSFLGAIATEHQLHSDVRSLRLFICANAVHNRYEQMVLRLINAVQTPFGTRVRHGVARHRKQEPEDWLQRMELGPAGYRDRTDIRMHTGRPGAAAFGPRVWLSPGSYLVQVELSIGELRGLHPLPRLLWHGGRIAYFQIAVGGVVLAKRAAFLAGARKRELILRFSIERPGGASDSELWIWTCGIVELRVSKVLVQRVNEGAPV